MNNLVEVEPITSICVYQLLVLLFVTYKSKQIYLSILKQLFGKIKIFNILRYSCISEHVIWSLIEL